MELTERATLIPPVGGYTGGASAATVQQPSARKPRCLRLVEHSNGIKIRATDQCPNERLPGSALCAHHLGEAAAEFRKLTGQPDPDGDAE